VKNYYFVRHGYGTTILLSIDGEERLQGAFEHLSRWRKPSMLKQRTCWYQRRCADSWAAADSLFAEQEISQLLTMTSDLQKVFE
jgi:hypothetical protein